VGAEEGEGAEGGGIGYVNGDSVEFAELGDMCACLVSAMGIKS
jgi:hypothetical protein